MQKKNFLPILALAVGHLVTDLQAGALPIVLPHLKELFTLSYSQLAAIVLTQNITSSVIQPVFGYITDKRSMPVLLPFCAAMAGAGVCRHRLGFQLYFNFIDRYYNRYSQCDLSSSGFKNC